MSRRAVRPLGFALAAALAVGAAVFVAAPAQAATPDDSAAQACWAALDTGESLCVPAGDDLVAAVEAAYGVDLVVPASAGLGDPAPVAVAAPAASGSARSLLQARTAVAAAAQSTVISVVYQNADYGGTSFAMSVSSGCGWGYSSLKAIGWNDKISSFRSYNGCKTALFVDDDYSGASTGYATSIANLATVGLNDKASSWSVH